MTKFLFLAGSTRTGSFNKKLARLAFQRAEEKGADATLIDLRDFQMPLYDGDLEAERGVPEAAIKLKKLFISHQGIFIASPEYNSSISPVLKNALDWISRKHEKEEGALVAFKGKVASLTAASTGALGGLRGLVPLRMMLGNIGVYVTPTQLAVPKAEEAFNNQGALVSEQHRAMLDSVVDELIGATNKLS